MGTQEPTPLSATQEAQAAHTTLGESSAAHLAGAATTLSAEAAASRRAADALRGAFATFRQIHDDGRASMRGWLRSALALVGKLHADAQAQLTAAHSGAPGSAHATGSNGAADGETRLQGLLEELREGVHVAALRNTSALDAVAAQQGTLEVRVWTRTAVRQVAHAALCEGALQKPPIKLASIPPG